jgi:4'-phosphopantetheinyl transferase
MLSCAKNTELSNNDLHVWSVQLDAAPELVGRLAQQLSIDEIDRAGRFRFARDCKRFVVARAVLRCLLGRYTGRSPKAIEFAYGPFGKPLLAQANRPLQFNLAHSGDLAVYAVALDDPVGVDVEIEKGRLDAESLARRFFSPRERAILESVAERERTHAFFTCWTRKEAFLKARGTGLTQPLDGFDVSLAPNEPILVRSVANDPTEADHWSLFGFEPVPGTIGAAAVRRRHAEMRFCGLHAAGDFGMVGSQTSNSR